MKSPYKAFMKKNYVLLKAIKKLCKQTNSNANYSSSNWKTVFTRRINQTSTAKRSVFFLIVNSALPIMITITTIPTIILTVPLLLAVETRSFDIDEFKATYCSDELDSYDELWCENFDLSTNDKDHIQKEDFVISEKSFVRFAKADIGVLNEDFFKKFPNAKTMHFLSSNVVFGSTENVTPHPLKLLTFKSCKMQSLENSNFLKSFEDLEELVIVNPKKFENIKIDTKFLENNQNLRHLILTLGASQKLSNDFMADGVLDVLPNLEYFSYNGKMEEITSETFKSNKNLTSLRLQNNGLSEIEGEWAFPESLQHLIISRNHLRNISTAFKGLSNLKMLDLSTNNIGNFEGCTFDDLVKLRVLFLDANELSCFAERHIENLKSLSGLYLRYNYLEEDDLKFIDRDKILFEFYPQRSRGFLGDI